MKFKKLILLLIIPFILSLASCMDLGNYASDKEYTDSFEVTIIKADGTKDTSYELSDFYNKEAEDLEYNEDDPVLEYSQYKYLILKPTKDLTVGDIYFYVSSDTDGGITCKISVEDHIPSKLANLDDNYSKLETYYSDKANDLLKPIEEQKDWSKIQPSFSLNDEPESFLASDTVTVTANKYDNVAYTKYTSTDSLGNSTISKSIELTENNCYIVIEFTNNTDSGVTFNNETSLEDAQTMIENRRKNRKNITFTMLLLEGK